MFTAYVVRNVGSEYACTPGKALMLGRENVSCAVQRRAIGGNKLSSESTQYVSDATR